MPVVIAVRRFVTIDLPILVAILMALSAVLSLVTIISIYREGGILKRLRATPLRPHTILTAHVIVKLLFTALTLLAMMAAGRRYYPAGVDAPVGPVWRRAALQHAVHRLDGLPDRQHRADGAFRAADRQRCSCIRCSGSPDCSSRSRRCRQRFAGSRAFLPLTYAVSLLRGIWRGDGWINHAGDVAALAIVLLVCTALASKVFRWE